MSYPSQYEAELVLKTNEALNNLYIGGASGTNTARLIAKWENELLQEFQCVFNHPDCSPWMIKTVRGKRTVAYRKNWKEAA